MVLGILSVRDKLAEEGWLVGWLVGVGRSGKGVWWVVGGGAGSGDGGGRKGGGRKGTGGMQGTVVRLSGCQVVRLSGQVPFGWGPDRIG
jgi:hypothetical protein